MTQEQKETQMKKLVLYAAFLVYQTLCKSNFLLANYNTGRVYVRPETLIGKDVCSEIDHYQK